MLGWFKNSDNIFGGCLCCSKICDSLKHCCGLDVDYKGKEGSDKISTTIFKYYPGIRKHSSVFSNSSDFRSDDDHDHILERKKYKKSIIDSILLNTLLR
ncbi:unnamed protein product [Gordionus sp. m RMFG-2023]